MVWPCLASSGLPVRFTGRIQRKPDVLYPGRCIPVVHQGASLPQHDRRLVKGGDRPACALATGARALPRGGVSGHDDRALDHKRGRAAAAPARRVECRSISLSGALFRHSPLQLIAFAR
jgi:hypothetical protein